MFVWVVSSLKGLGLHLFSGRHPGVDWEGVSPHSAVMGLGLVKFSLS